MNYSKNNHEHQNTNRHFVSKAIKNLISIVILVFTISATAQQGINYKALVKDEVGNVVANDNIDVQFQILQGAGMTNVYQEIHTSTTDANGIVIINIGEGTTSDVFADIDWGSDDHYLNVQIDTGGGLTDMGTTQFMAVPYALNAQNAQNAENAQNAVSAQNAVTADNAATKIDELSDGKSDTDGSQDGSSIFLGIDAGLNDDGTDNKNVGVGFEALSSNTTGGNNNANGFQALYSGIQQVILIQANGSQALYFNATGNYNSALGRRSSL